MIGQVKGAPVTTATRRSVIFRSEGMEALLTVGTAPSRSRSVRRLVAPSPAVARPIFLKKLRRSTRSCTARFMIASWFLRGAEAPRGERPDRERANYSAGPRVRGRTGIIAAKAQVSVMDTTGRRGFMAGMAASGLLAGMGRSLLADEAGPRPRRMTRDLICGNLGVKATQRDAIDLASRYCFESVFPDPPELGRLSQPDVRDLLPQTKAEGIV